MAERTNTVSHHASLCDTRHDSQITRAVQLMRLFTYSPLSTDATLPESSQQRGRALQRQSISQQGDAAIKEVRGSLLSSFN
jgi:hypothetical protein